MTGPIFEIPFEKIASNLRLVSIKLRDLLPDPSIGPEERLERLSRVVPGSIQYSRFHLSARTKLRTLCDRLDELVPQFRGDPVNQIDHLVNVAISQTPQVSGPLVQRLEALGDHRIADNGR